MLDFAGNTIEDDKFSVSTLIEKANKNVGMYVLHRLFVFCSFFFRDFTIFHLSNQVSDHLA